ncbi:MAG: GNAT family N-acetyltransferase [Candidatus Lokiarchaeota archaeon]|nr:GNAT family N-acetyltransferase [Candidatus Lokiarchaeota archaeon]
MEKRFTLKDGRSVSIKRMAAADYQPKHKYDFVHEWLHQVSEYLLLDFNTDRIEDDRKWFLEKLSDSEHYIVLGALFKEKIVAQTSLELNPKFKKKVRHIGSWGIAINPKFQNQGLGERMLLEIENIAREKGLEKLEVSYIERNDAAEKLYLEKLYYMVEGRRKHGLKLHDGTYLDRILIGKILN